MTNNIKRSRLVIVASILCAGFIFNQQVLADIAIIAHPSIGIESITAKEVKSIFMAKKKKFPNGDTVIPVDQDAGKEIKSEFNKKVLGKKDSQLRSYWGRMIFAGKKKPPKAIGGDNEVKAYVASNPGSLGYIDSSKVDDSVKVLLTVK